MDNGKKSKNFIKIGNRYGSLIVIKRVEDFEGESDIRAQWLCKCDCGKEVRMVNRYILRPQYPTCGSKSCKKKQ